jgi:hypothetical protein
MDRNKLIRFAVAGLITYSQVFLTGVLLGSCAGNDAPPSGTIIPEAQASKVDPVADANLDLRNEISNLAAFVNYRLMAATFGNPMRFAERYMECDDYARFLLMANSTKEGAYASGQPSPVMCMMLMRGLEVGDLHSSKDLTKSFNEDSYTGLSLMARLMLQKNPLAMTRGVRLKEGLSEETALQEWAQLQAELNSKQKQCISAQMGLDGFLKKLDTQSTQAEIDKTRSEFKAWEKRADISASFTACNNLR